MPSRYATRRPAEDEGRTSTRPASRPEQQASAAPQSTSARVSQQSPQQAPAPSHEPDRLEKLVNAVRNGWSNLLSMEQNLAEGTKFGLLDINMPTPDGPRPLGEVIKDRIATLKAQAAERNAA